MAGEAEDRRVRRTRRRLKEALLELINEREYEAITVEDITRRADVGRSTFYSHFDSKEELLFSGFDAWLLSLADAAGAGSGADPSPGFRFSLPFLHHVRTQKRFFQAAIEHGSNARLRRKLTALLVEVVRRELDRASPLPARAAGSAEQAREAQAHAVAGAFLGLAAWWLSAGKGLSPEAADQVFQRTVAHADGPAPEAGS